MKNSTLYFEEIFEKCYKEVKETIKIKKMKIELHEIPVKDLVSNYKNNDEEGVVGYGGKLNIRPKYQREFIYGEKERDAVIKTINSGFPLNIMYWAENSDGTLEVLDGQQRIISICEYVKGNYSFNYRGFYNLTEEEKNKILDYKLMVFFCEGKEKEKLDWFTTINIAGKTLTKQELRNAVYSGSWLLDAKKYFSKTKCPAYEIAKSYMNGSPIRQDYLETVLQWKTDDNIENYMSQSQNLKNANEIWGYFKNVIGWIETIFPIYRKEMKGVEWGVLYNKYRDHAISISQNEDLEKTIKNLMLDEDVTKKSGIYEYLLSGNEKTLSIRAFSDNQKRIVYERQNGICPVCGKFFEFEEMEADHVIAWHDGGKTVLENCQMLCKIDNRRKSGK